MSVKAQYRNGALKLIGKAKGLTPGRVYTVLTEDELRDLRETLYGRNANDGRFDFWDNDYDPVYGPE